MVAAAAHVLHLGLPATIRQLHRLDTLSTLAEHHSQTPVALQQAMENVLQSRFQSQAKAGKLSAAAAAARIRRIDAFVPRLISHAVSPACRCRAPSATSSG